jgi:hypothetical protein
MLSPGILLPSFPMSMENRDLGRWFGTVFRGLRRFGTLSDGLWKPVVSHHEQIYELVHGVATDENSATMSLYGYNLA